MESLTELTVSGNPLCDGNVTVCDPSCSSKIQRLLDMEGFGCKKQCSDFCLDKFLEAPGCAIECNVPSCGFSNGGCSEM